jgi:hypothetical protein
VPPIGSGAAVSLAFFEPDGTFVPVSRPIVFYLPRKLGSVESGSQARRQKLPIPSLIVAERQQLTADEATKLHGHGR